MKQVTQMTGEDKKNFKPTPEMIMAAETVFLAMAFTETIRPVVVGYQTKVLEKHKFLYTRKEDGDYVKTSEHTYLMKETDFKIYLEECNKEQELAGLKTETPDHCPLLVAENEQRKAENILMEVFKPLTGLDVSRINMRLDTRKKFLDLTLKYMSRFVDTKKTLEGLNE